MIGHNLRIEDRDKDMKLPTYAGNRPSWLQRLIGVFNLNDSRWGRGEDKPSEGAKPENTPVDNEPVRPPPESPPQGGRKGGSNAGPPDLDELWRDFNRKLGGFFGGSVHPPRGNGPRRSTTSWGTPTPRRLSPKSTKL